MSKGAPATEVDVSTRYYAVGQGYEMTRTVRVTNSTQARPKPEHTLRVVVHQGNSAESAWARADRWDGTQWHEVVRLSDVDVEGGGPSYSVWNWHRDDPAYATAIAHHEDCVAWLNRVGDRTLADAKDVILR